MAGLRGTDAHHGKLIVPMGPQVRTIAWADAYKNFLGQKPSAETLNGYVMYYTRTEAFKYHLNRLCVGFSLNPFGPNESDELFGLPIGNLDAGYGVCFYEWPYSNDPSDFCSQVISQYWSSWFVDYRDEFSHWMYDYTHKAENRNFYSDWLQATTKKDYNWIMGQRLMQSNFTVTLKQLFQANKTLTDETEIMVPNG